MRKNALLLPTFLICLKTKILSICSCWILFRILALIISFFISLRLLLKIGLIKVA